MFLFEHDLFRKPVPTFRDPALVADECPLRCQYGPMPKRNFTSAPRSLMSLRAELLRLSLKTLKAAKKVRKPRNIPPEKVRRRLKLLEPVVPRAPSGTKTTIIDIDGINAVETVARHARTDCCVLYFHGGGYAFGTEPLVRDFTWRLGAAA